MCDFFVDRQILSGLVSQATELRRLATRKEDILARFGLDRIQSHSETKNYQKITMEGMRDEGAILRVA